MLERVSSRELEEWREFYQLEPFGSEAYYIGTSIVAQTVANVNRSKNRKAYKVDDFMPKFGKKKQSVDQMVQLAEMLTIGLGGEDLRDG